MAWDNAVVTNSGISLLQQVLAGGKLTIDGVTGGAGMVDPGVLKEQTALVDQKQTLTVAGVYNVANGKKLNIQIVSAGLTTGYTLQQIGIWAHVDAGASVLFAIIQDSNGFAIPSETELPDFSINVLAVVNFSNGGSFSFEMDPSALVTMSTLLNMLPLKIKDLTLPTIGWTEYTEGELAEVNYQYDFVHGEISANFIVDIYPHNDSLDETAACGLAEVNTSYDGGVIFYAANIPSQEINFDMKITRG